MMTSDTTRARMPFMSPFKFLFNLVVIAAALYFGGQYFLAQKAEASLPELCRNMPQDAKAADDLFVKRVQDRFPAGMQLTPMTLDLESQGFTVAQIKRTATFSAQRKTQTQTCEQHWTIEWSAHMDNTLGKTQPAYTVKCTPTPQAAPTK